MLKPRVPRKYDGVVYQRAGAEIWWICYRDSKDIALTL